MAIEVQSRGAGRFLISCTGELEWTARTDIVELFQAQMGEESLSMVVLDLTRVSYINSAGIGAIFSLRQYIHNLGGDFVITRPTPSVERILSVAGVLKIITVIESVETAWMDHNPQPAQY